MIRFGVIGTNKITDMFISHGKDHDNFSVSAVYSRTYETGHEFAKKHNIKNIYANVTEMAKSGEIDAVYIASPNFLHIEQSMVFLDHKIPVLCEKPAASNVTEIRKIVECAKANNTLFMEAMMPPFLPNFGILQENVLKLGRINHVVFNFCQKSSRLEKYKNSELPNAFNPAYSNGSIMDIGVYCVNNMVRLFGMPNEINATSINLKSGVDGGGSVLCRYDGFDVILQHSKIMDSHLPSFIQGENGTLLIDKMNSPTKIIYMENNGKKNDLSVPQKYGNMYYELNEFINLMQTGSCESKINSFDISINEMNIIDEIRRQTGVVFPADNLY